MLSGPIDAVGQIPIASKCITLYGLARLSALYRLFLGWRLPGLVKLLKYVTISLLAGCLYATNGFAGTVQVFTADVEVLTSMAVRQAVATWKPVEVSNGPYHVKVTPRSKTRLPNCALLHHVVRKQGKIVRDHLLKRCDDEAK